MAIEIGNVKGEEIDPSKIVHENFSIKEVLGELLDDTEEQVAKGLITMETALKLRQVYRNYLSGNTPTSFTTDAFVQVTAVELTFRLFKILGKDPRLGRNVNAVALYVSSVVDLISLALRRAIGGKERSLLLGNFKIISGMDLPDYGKKGGVL